MLTRRNVPFKWALRTVKINRMAEGAITTRENQVIATNINIVDYRVRFKIIVEGNFNMEVQPHKVDPSLENLNEVPFTNNSKLVPLVSMTFKKIIYRRNTKCTTGRKTISVYKTMEKSYTRPRNFVNSEGVSDTIHKSHSSGEGSKHNKNV